MNVYTDDSPIIACSTGTNSNTAIAVLRMSGFVNILDLQKFFSFDFKKIIPRKSHLSNLGFSNKILDNVLIVYFPKGASYTGENVLEISVHGNQLNIQRILDLFISNSSFRHAHPGEFTYRALKNKKLNLSQVEGLDMLLNANSSLMLSQGLDILQGDLYSQYLALHDSFLKLKAALEISIDFSEDVGADEVDILFKKSFAKFFQIISDLNSRTKGNLSSLLSPEIVIVGQTNAGKSSLFNILVSHDRSIVSSIAGTTRDYISEVIHIDGTNFKLVDTAGIRDSQDLIENIGIDRAFHLLGRAFFKILIINPFETNAHYLDKFTNENFDLIILSHCDLVDFDKKIVELKISKIKTNFLMKASFLEESGSIEPLYNSGPMGPVFDNFGPIEPKLESGGSIGPDSELSGPIGPKLELSGPIGPRSELLGSMGASSELPGPIGPKIKISGPIEPVVSSFISDKFNKITSNNPILLERHRHLINKIYLDSLSFYNDFNTISDVAILSSEVNILGNNLSELIGILSPEDVLNSIFANFCIGK